MTLVLKNPHLPPVRKILRALGAAARKAQVEHARDFGYTQMTAFKSRLRHQDFDSFDAHPLSPAYAARKRALKLDPRTMIATGHYVKHIQLHERPDGLKRTIFIGFEDGAKAVDHDGRETDITLDLLAKVQEHGSQAANVPPRPHWQDHLDRMHQAAPAVRTAIKDEAINAARGAG